MSPGKKEFVSVKIDGVKQHMQKCVSLINLKELHLQFKKATDIKIGFSKICELRPKWGIPVGSASGAHSVCVCEYHQNAKLMAFAIPGVTDYKDLIETVVCDIENRDCMLHSCENCPSIDELKNFLTTKFEEIDNKDVKFKQWKKEEKNKTNLLSLEMSVEEFTEEVCRQIELVHEHHFIAKSQANFLKELITCLIKPRPPTAKKNFLQVFF